MPTIAEKLSLKEKVGYALGDTAAYFIFQTMVMFQLAFYTDTFGITAAAVGTLLVVVRVWDAIFDPIMGVVAHRTKTKWGKFRRGFFGPQSRSASWDFLRSSRLISLQAENLCMST